MSLIYYKRDSPMRSCLAMIVNEFVVDAIKIVVKLRVPVQQFVQHRQGLRVDPYCGEEDHESHHVGWMGGMVGWDDAEDAEAREGLVVSLE